MAVAGDATRRDDLAAGIHARHDACCARPVQAVKQHYDADNVFRMNLNVPPAAQKRAA